MVRRRWCWVLETRTCGLGCLTTAAVFCCLQRHLTLVLHTDYGTHHTTPRFFFIGLVDPDPGLAKMAPLKKKKKRRNVLFWSAGCSLLRAGGAFCICEVLHRDLEIKKYYNFWYFKKNSTVIFFFSNSWIRIRIYLKCWIRIWNLNFHMFSQTRYIFSQCWSLVHQFVYMGAHDMYYPHFIWTHCNSSFDARDPVFLPRFVDSLHLGWDPDSISSAKTSFADPIRDPLLLFFYLGPNLGSIFFWILHSQPIFLNLSNNFGLQLL